jgi:hypothetical protein
MKSKSQKYRYLTEAAKYGIVAQSLRELSMQTICARCNMPMLCLPEGECWCATLPHIWPVPGGDGTKCLCQNCLEQWQNQAREAGAVFSEKE